MKNCDICANDTFRESWMASGVARRAFPPPSWPAAEPATAALGGGSAAVSDSPATTAADQEALIQAITDRVMEVLQT